MQPHTSHCNASTRLISVRQIEQNHFVLSSSLSMGCARSVFGIVDLRPYEKHDKPPRSPTPIHCGGALVQAGRGEFHDDAHAGTLALPRETVRFLRGRRGYVGEIYPRGRRGRIPIGRGALQKGTRGFTLHVTAGSVAAARGRTQFVVLLQKEVRGPAARNPRGSRWGAGVGQEQQSA
jgi:hypothetical protein